MLVKIAATGWHSIEGCKMWLELVKPTGMLSFDTWQGFSCNNAVTQYFSETKFQLQQSFT